MDKFLINKNLFKIHIYEESKYIKSKNNRDSKEYSTKLKEYRLEITKTFYKIMLENNSEVKGMFNMDKQESGEQPKALAMTILAAAQNIDKLEVLLQAVKKVEAVHVNSKVKPGYYPIVGKNLLLPIKEVLGDAATEDVINAWAEAYEVIAKVFIDVEKDLYLEN